MSFGAGLKRERELRGISLEEISRATKIGVRMLEAIESDRFNILPGGIFRRSFIKSYANYLGMDAETVLQEYSLTVEGAASSATPATEQTVNRLLPANEPQSRKLKIAIAVVIVLLLIVINLWYWGSSAREHGNIRPSSPSMLKQGSSSLDLDIKEEAPMSGGLESGDSVNQDLPAEVTDPSGSHSAEEKLTTSVSSAESELKVLGELAKKSQPEPALMSGSLGEPGESGQLTLQVEAIEQAWISVSSGETLIFSGLMQPHESQNFQLEKPLQVVLGNAGGTRISVNGRPFVSLGRPGEVRTLEINSDNYRQFLIPAQ